MKSPEDRQETVSGAHLVGSVPYPTVEDVFRGAADLLGDHLHRIPDGEVGERKNWVACQLPVFTSCDAFEWTGEDSGYSAAAPRRIKLKDGKVASDIRFGNLGYADVAIESFGTFDALQTAGTIPAGIRFQVCLPTPVAPVHLWVRREDQSVVERQYELAMLSELRRIIESIPADRLAIQWDTAVEFGILEGCFPTYMDTPMANIVARLVRLGDVVPVDTELGYHLCYGDAGHRHFVEPGDVSKLVDVANQVAARLQRPLNWIHMPVPKDRDDEAYFAPAQHLALPQETELYLGLLHSDGVEGARPRIEAALAHIPAFGVATECGFGRRKAETIEALLQQHAAVSHPVR